VLVGPPPPAAASMAEEFGMAYMPGLRNLSRHRRTGGRRAVSRLGAG
jgi:hypothetical protein